MPATSLWQSARIVTFVSEPKSIFIRDETKGVEGAQAIQIWDRFWANPDGKGWWPESLDDIKVEPAEPGVIEAARLLHDLMIMVNKSWLESITKRLDGLWTDRVANVSGGLTYVDSIPCLGYTLSEPDQDRTWQICLDAGRRLPIQIVETQGDIRLATYRFSHFNEPGNVIEPRTEKGLHSDDARMALNGLASFQWTKCLEWEPGSTAPQSLAKPFVHCSKGTWVQSDQVFKVSVWNDEALTGVPWGRFLCRGQDCWQSIGREDAAWWPLESESLTAATMTGPWWPWLLAANAHQFGSLVPDGATTVGGQRCSEYLYSWEEDENKYELRLSVLLDSRLPLRAHLVRSGAQGTMDDATELHNLDDPANVVEPPPETP